MTHTDPSYASARLMQTRPIYHGVSDCLQSPVSGRKLPFDLQEIPPAMRKMGWNMSAELTEQWFNGPLNYSHTESDDNEGIDQNGKPYAAEFIETKRFTWEWLCKHKSLDKDIAWFSTDKYMRNTERRSEMRANVLAAVARRGPVFIGTINSQDECGTDLMELHSRYQFMQARRVRCYTNMDLSYCLGDGLINVAIAHIEVRRQAFAPHTANVTHIYLYVKEKYSFTEDPSKPSQYLGHWSRAGMVYAHLRIADKPSIRISKIRPSRPLEGNVQHVDFPIFKESDPDTVYYPLYKRDFFNWQMKHQRGSNIISFSDLKLVRLEQPIQFHLPK